MQDRIKRWTEALMMIPGLSGFEGNVRRYIKAELKALGVSSKTDMLGNLSDPHVAQLLHHKGRGRAFFQRQARMGVQVPPPGS
jgi:hypothetical protein